MWGRDKKGKTHGGTCHHWHLVLRGHIEKLGTGRGRAGQPASKRLKSIEQNDPVQLGSAQGGKTPRYFDKPRSHNTQAGTEERRVRSKGKHEAL